MREVGGSNPTYGGRFYLLWFHQPGLGDVHVDGKDLFEGQLREGGDRGRGEGRGYAL